MNSFLSFLYSMALLRGNPAEWKAIKQSTTGHSSTKMKQELVEYIWHYKFLVTWIVLLSCYVFIVKIWLRVEGFSRSYPPQIQGTRNLTIDKNWYFSVICFAITEHPYSYYQFYKNKKGGFNCLKLNKITSLYNVHYRL